MQKSAKLNLLVWVSMGSIAALLQFNACTYNNEEELYGITACDTAVATYAAKVEPIIDSKCYSCHNDLRADDYGSGIYLEGYGNLASWAESSLVCVIEHASDCSPMPKGSGKIDACDIEAVRSWVASGYPNN